MNVSPQQRRPAPQAARAVAMIALGLLVLGLVGLSTTAPAGAATDNGRARIVDPNGAQPPLRRGGSATPFNVKLGANPACPGDSAGGDHRVQSFMIPASADINAMTFDASGPVAVEGQFRQPLFGVDSSPYVDKLTDLAVPPAVTGGISGLPTFDFGVFAPGDVPAGRYSIGIGCTLGPAGPNQLTSFWSTSITVTASAGDQPAGITWTTSPPGGPPPPPAGDPTTSGGPTAEPRGGPTTTTTVDSTTTTAPSTSTTVAFSGANPSDPSVSSTVGQLPFTGSSPWYRVAWGACLILFGRMIFLFARRPKVRPPSAE